VALVFIVRFDQYTGYGTIKRLGERWIHALEHGRIARIWNAYGMEPVGLRSHVIADWVRQFCLEMKKEKSNLVEMHLLRAKSCLIVTFDMSAIDNAFVLD